MKKRGLQAQAENLALALAAMVSLPLAESVLRAMLAAGISGVTAVVQHLTLIVGTLVGAIAARENRLLALSTGALLPPGRVQAGGRLLAHAFAAAIAATVVAAGGAALILFWDAGQPVAWIPLDHYRLVTNPTLPTLYACVVEALVYRDLKMVREVPRVMAECRLPVGGVLLIVKTGDRSTRPRAALRPSFDARHPDWPRQAQAVSDTVRSGVLAGCSSRLPSRR